MENNPMNDAGLLAALGIVSACVAGLIWVIKFMFSKLMPMIEKSNILAEQGIKVGEANTSATKAADSYLRERNGRDAEHHRATLKAINAIPSTLKKIANAQEKAIIKAVKVERQSVTEQKVEHQTIRSQD